jgi:hypothetical protein
MTAGSVAGTALVPAWSCIDGLVALYPLWVAMGVVMAAVVYKPAFIVVAKHFGDPAECRRAMTLGVVLAAVDRVRRGVDHAIAMTVHSAARHGQCAGGGAARASRGDRRQRLRPTRSAAPPGR